MTTTAQKESLISLLSAYKTAQRRNAIAGDADTLVEVQDFFRELEEQINADLAKTPDGETRFGLLPEGTVFYIGGDGDPDDGDTVNIWMKLDTDGDDSHALCLGSTGGGFDDLFEYYDSAFSDSDEVTVAPPALLQQAAFNVGTAWMAVQEKFTKQSQLRDRVMGFLAASNKG